MGGQTYAVTSEPAKETTPVVKEEAKAETPVTESAESSVPSDTEPKKEEA